MANWISSKLKVAESLLQQIDQQAAESLGKGEKRQLDGLDFDASPKPIANVSLRDQLKKKAPENAQSLGKLSSDLANHTSSRKLSVSGNDNDSVNRKEFVKENEKPQSNPGGNALNDTDWTELLSTQKQQPAPAPSESSSVNGVSGIRGARRGAGKVRNAGVNVKGNGKAVGTVRKVGRGKDGRVEREGDERREREEGGNSDSTPRVAGVGSGDRISEGSVEEKDVEIGRDILENGSRLQGYEKLVVADDSPSLVKKTQGEVFDQVCEKRKEMIWDEERIRRATSTSKVDRTRNLKSASRSGSDDESDSDSGSSSSSESEREREERRQQILAAKAAAKAALAIKERENLVARLEGEKQSLEKMVEEQAKQAAQEASKLQSTMMEMMEAVEVEKQKHNHTRMEVLARLAKLETANADLAKALATAQWNLEMEVDRVGDLRQQVELKEVIHEELQRGICSSQQTSFSPANSVSAKGIELEKEMLEAEYSFVADKCILLQEKAAKLEDSIISTQKEMENPTEVEFELKRRLRQMTDHLIQKQSQVEALSSDKAMLLFRIEAVSRLLDENKSLLSAGDFSGSSREDLEAGAWESSASKLRPMFEEKIESGKQHLGSLLRQLDAIFSAGSVFLARIPAAKLWALVYLVCLHLWVLYILFSHSRSAGDSTSSYVISLENINNTRGI